MKQRTIIPFPKYMKTENAVNALNIFVKDVGEDVCNVCEEHGQYDNIESELNEPLNLIHGNIQLMEMFAQDVTVSEKYRIRRSIDSIKRNCFKLTKLMNNMIEIQKIKDDGLYLNLDNLNIVEIIEDTVIHVSEALRNKKIILDTNVEEKYIYCDLEKIQKSVLVLLYNAIRFSGSEEILVNLNVENNNVEIKITFKNKDSKCLNFIIDKMDNLSTNSINDTSIGFHICKSIVNLHEGTISVGGIADEIDFSIKLPCESNDGIHYLYRNDKILNSENTIEKIKIEFSDIDYKY